MNTCILTVLLSTGNREISQHSITVDYPIETFGLCNSNMWKSDERFMLSSGGDTGRLNNRKNSVGGSPFPSGRKIEIVTSDDIQ